MRVVTAMTWLVRRHESERETRAMRRRNRPLTPAHGKTTRLFGEQLMKARFTLVQTWNCMFYALGEIEHSGCCEAMSEGADLGG